MNRYDRNITRPKKAMAITSVTAVAPKWVVWEGFLGRDARDLWSAFVNTAFIRRNLSERIKYQSSYTIYEKKTAFATPLEDRLCTV